MPTAALAFAVDVGAPRWAGHADIGSGESAPQPRGLAALPDGSVLIACADDTDSKLLRLPDPRCGLRGRAACAPPQRWASAGLAHPYGLALDTSAAAAGRGLIFVSNQDSGVVTAYDVMMIRNNESMPTGVYDGVRTSYGSKPGALDLRGVAARAGRLYVAAEARDAVYVHDASTGVLLGAIAVRAPIALALDATTGDLLIGSNEDARLVAYRWRESAGRVVREYVCDSAACGGHAAGVAVRTDARASASACDPTRRHRAPPPQLSPDGTALFVLGQNSGVLVQFNASDGAVLGTVLTGLRRPQQLLLLPADAPAGGSVPPE